MSKEQFHAYKKFRDADDVQGNLAWSARVSRKAFCQAPESARLDVEKECAMANREKLIWRLLATPRGYMDLENLGILDVETVRGVLRGLVAADLIDILDGDEKRGIVPLEVRRLKAEIKGIEGPKKVSGKSSLRARVYRPTIDSPVVAEAQPSVPAPVALDEEAQSVPLGAEAAALKERIIADYAQLKGRNHYDFLGVPTEATAETIRAAYMNKARELHPDRIAGSIGDDEEARKKADKLFKRLQEAYQTLSTAPRREAYDHQLSLGEAKTEGKQRRPEDARLMLTKAEHLLRKNDFRAARTHFKRAFDYDDRLSAAEIGLGWANYNDPASDDQSKKAAKEMMERLVKDGHGDAAYKLALIAHQDGDAALAIRHIEKAVRLDPKHKKAQQEYRIMKMRRDKAAEKDKKKGFFSR